MHARFIVAWGANIVSSNVHLWPFIEEARRRGARLVAVDPYRSRTAEKADQHLALLPGTDARARAGHDARDLPRRPGGPRLPRRATRSGADDAARARARSGRPRAPRRSTGLRAARGRGASRASTPPRSPRRIRLNYGLNRHAGGGHGRAHHRLPARASPAPGAIRAAACCCRTSGTFPVERARRSSGPTWSPPGTRTLNMSQLGRILLDATLAPPVKALFVYNSQPGGGGARAGAACAQGFAREDLFTVVHELFQTDTVDFADIVLPATTTLEHYDIHKAYGHLYLSLSRPAIAPLGESKPNTEVFRLLAARMGLDHPGLRESDEEMARQALRLGPSAPGAASTSSGSSARASVRLQRARSLRARSRRAASRRRRASASCTRRRSRRSGLDPAARLRPAARERRQRIPSWRARYPLAFISPPAHHFLNSTFSAQPVFVRRESEPSLTIHPEDAGARGIATGRRAHFNDRGSFLARRASPTRRAGRGGRPVDLVGEDVPGRPQRERRHRQELTDMGGGATFYDVLVEVAPGLSVDVVASRGGAVVALVQYLRVRDRRCCRSWPLRAWPRRTRAGAWRRRSRRRLSGSPTTCARRTAGRRELLMARGRRRAPTPRAALRRLRDGRRHPLPHRLLRARPVPLRPARRQRACW